MAPRSSFEEERAGEIWRTHRRWLSAVLLAHRPRGADLDDLLQEVALIVTRRLGDLREPERLMPWLRAIAVNVARGAARRAAAAPAQSTAPEELDGLAAAASDLERLELQEEARHVLCLALALAPEYREPLFLRCLDGMSQRDIAEALGLPETTVETRIARARKALREAAERRLSRAGEPRLPSGERSV